MLRESSEPTSAMTIDPPLITGLDLECRSLCAQPAFPSLPTRFFVGTHAIQHLDNQIHVLEYDETEHSIARRVFRHTKGQIWHMLTSSKDCRLLMTNFESQPKSPTLKNHLAVWKMPEDVTRPFGLDNPVVNDLEFKCVFDTASLKLDEEVGRQARLRPESEDSVVLTLETNLALIDIEKESLVQKLICDGLSKNNKTPLRSSKVQTITWNPHFNGNILAYTTGTNVCTKDLREQTKTGSAWSILNAHHQAVRDVDFNPNSQYYLATCGDDCDAKFWDIRNTSAPVLVYREHSHWLWSIQYNSFYDNLVLTGSSDGNVNLLRVSSISSTSYKTLTDDISGDNAMVNLGNDGLVHKYREHEDSVYGCKWSCNDSWTFGSISYDGRFILNKVPREEKQALKNFSLSQLMKEAVE